MCLGPHFCFSDEWAWLQSHNMLTANEDTEGEDETSMDSSGLGEFVRSLRAAVTLLLTKLNIPLYRVTMVSLTLQLTCF